MATPKSKPRSRKRRRSRSAPVGGASGRRDRARDPGAPRGEPGVKGAGAARSDEQPQPRLPRQRSNPLGAYGERPQGLFAGLPISELAILAGGVALVIGVVRQAGAALIGGLVICVLGVTEVTAREHFSGYRSHTVLLAAVPAVVSEFVITLTVGAPRVRALLLVPVAAVFALCAWLLRRRFMVARQARLARPLKR